MSVQHLEEQITPKLKWNKMGDIPDFRLKKFEDVRRRVEVNQFGVGIDFTVSNEFAQWLTLFIL